MVSVEGLAKLVDPSQLTDDFEGSLDYNHEEWMDLRVSLEEFMSNAVHLLSRLEDLQVGCAQGQNRRLKEQLQKTDCTLCVSGAAVQEGVPVGRGGISAADRGAHAAEEKGEGASKETGCFTPQSFDPPAPPSFFRLQVLKAPVEELDREGQRLLQCIRSSDGFSGRNCISGSADFQSLVPKVSLHTRAQLVGGGGVN